MRDEAHTDQRPAKDVMDALGDEIAEAAANLDAATQRLLAKIREFDAGGGWFLQGAASCAQWLSWRIGLSDGAAREKVRVAKALGELPLIEAALGRGEISYSKVRAMTRVATAETEELLLTMAEYSTGAQLEKICRMFRGLQRLRAGDVREVDDRRWVRTRRTDDGMVRLTAQLTVDEAARVMKGIETAARDAMGEDPDGEDVSAEMPGPVERERGGAWRTPNMADGLVGLAESYLRGETGKAPVEVVVTVEGEALETGDGVAECDGELVSAETARRLSCDAGIVEVTVDAHGTPLDIGRRSRSVPPALKRALKLRDRTCTFPGCTHERWTDAHHIQHWGQNGDTALDNLVLLCGAHHRLVHEGDYTVALDATGRARFWDGEGREVGWMGRRRLRGDAAAVSRANREAGLAIDARTGLTTWEGRPPDYTMCVDALWTRSQRGRRSYQASSTAVVMKSGTPSPRTP